MESEYHQIAAITQLEQSPYDSHTGALLAKRFERLLKRQRSEITQLKSLRRDLNRLPAGAQREAIARQIRAFTADHAHRLERYTNKLVEEARPTGKG